MVLEALAAVGLAGNVVQFVHIAASLLSRFRKIQRSSLGLPDEYIDIKVVMEDLLVLSDKIVATSAPNSSVSRRGKSSIRLQRCIHFYDGRRTAF